VVEENSKTDIPVALDGHANGLSMRIIKVTPSNISAQVTQQQTGTLCV
jgi:hypothetical protein